VPIKDAEIRFSPNEEVCHRCGHPRLITAARPQGLDCLWYAYCPSCRQVQELAAIPGWFSRGLPTAPATHTDLH
jgi:hypothetical protein